MRITESELRKLVRKQLLENLRQVDLANLPDRAAVSDAWPTGVTLRGKNVYDTFYKNDGVMSSALRLLQDEGYGDAQESYLGYDPDSDTFVMGFDAWYDGPTDYEMTDSMGGEMEGVLISLDTTGRPLRVLTSAPGGMYPEGRKEVMRRHPSVIDVRLD